MKKGNPKSTGESDDETNKSGYRNKVRQNPHGDCKSDSEDSVKVVKPPPKKISMVDLCNAPSDDGAPSDMDISQEGKTSGETSTKEKEKENEEEVELSGDSDSDNGKDEENVETNKQENTSNTTTKESSNKSNEIAEKERKDKGLFNDLVLTIRGYPFSKEHLLGKDRKEGNKFMQLQETLYRITKSMENPEEQQNIKEIFYEAAIDSPEMFQGYTHYKDSEGFIKDRKDKDFDLFLEYVNMIDKKNPERGREGENFPHPKWLEFRRRVDRCRKDKEGNWNLSDVFIEASRLTSFSSAKKGKHYNKGFGFVTTKKINKINQKKHTDQRCQKKNMTHYFRNL